VSGGLRCAEADPYSQPSSLPYLQRPLRCLQPRGKPRNQREADSGALGIAGLSGAGNLRRKGFSVRNADGLQGLSEARLSEAVPWQRECRPRGWVPATYSRAEGHLFEGTVLLLRRT